MDLDFDYKEGCYLFSGTSFPEVVIHKTIYKLVTITFQNYGDYKPFDFRVYDLTNKLDVELLNEKYKRTMADQDPDDKYGILLGTIVEYDYLKLIYLSITDKKILSFVLQRPVLFDYLKARDKYLVAEALNAVSSLQGEFNTTWEQYFRIPLESKEKIEWEVISPPIPLKSNVNENLLTDEFGDKFTDTITVYDFLNVIDTDTFNKIPNQEIKDEISKLIKKTLEIAKENSVIGKEDPNKKPKQPQKQSKEEVRFNVEFTYKLNPSDKEVLTVEEFVYGVDEEDALAKAPNYFYDIYEGKNYDLISVSLAEEKELIKAVEPINDVIEENASKTIYKIKVIVS
jgi:hypothetical protein